MVASENHLIISFFFTWAELHGPVLVRSSDSNVFSCWATGRPAPTLTISVLQQDVQLESNSSVNIDNSNGTVTVNTTAVLAGRPGNGTHVLCTAQVFSHSQTTTLTLTDLDEEPELQTRNRCKRNVTCSALQSFTFSFWRFKFLSFVFQFLLRSSYSISSALVSILVLPTKKHHRAPCVNQSI